MTLPEHLRDRLYEAYSSDHAGRSDQFSGIPAFRQNVLPHLPVDRSKAVVDIGCGQGRLVEQMVLSGFGNAYGVDISPEQVALAHANGVSQVRLGDFRQALAPASLNAVTAIDLFEHLTKPEVLEALDRVYDALLIGGILVMQVPNAVSPFGGNYRFGDFTHETFFTARSLRQLAAAAGFRQSAVSSCPPPRHGFKSAVRANLWKVVAGGMKAALAVETGALRGHHVTQNIVAVFTK